MNGTDVEPVNEVEVFNKDDPTSFFPELNTLISRLVDLEYSKNNVLLGDLFDPLGPDVKDILIDNLQKEIDFIMMQLKTLGEK